MNKSEESPPMAKACPPGLSDMPCACSAAPTGPPIALTIVIPVYNEEAALEGVLRECLALARARGWRVIAVNDGSRDGSAAILDRLAREDLLLTVLHHKLNRGYGGALKTGIAAASTEYVVTIDADGQHRLEDIDRLFEAIQSTGADMVVGGRKGQKSASLYRAIGKWMIRGVARLLMPIPIYDINSGMKIYRTDLARRYLALCPDSMAFSDVITLVFLNQRHLVGETSIVIRSRSSGVSTINTRTAFETLREILNIVVLFNPMRVFLPASVLSIVCSLIWGIPIVLRGRGVSVGAMLGLLVGVLLFFLGLLAEQLSMLRKALAVQTPPSPPPSPPLFPPSSPSTPSRKSK